MAQEERLRELASALTIKLRAIENHPSYRGVWELAMLHGQEYKGPNWEQELIELEQALSAAPAPSPLTEEQVRDMLRNFFCPHLRMDEYSEFVDNKKYEGTGSLIVTWGMKKRLEQAINALLASPAEQTGAPVPESGWLIESVDSSWLFFRDDHKPDWTHDSLKALRFARKQDAEAVMFALPDVLRVAAQASEHRWGL